MLRILLTSIFLLTVAGSYAQTYSVKGSVKDTAGVPLTGTLIKLKWGSDSTATSVNIAGEFSLQNVKSAEFTLSAAFIGFQSFVKQYKIENGASLVIPPIILKEGVNSLSEVVITAVTAMKVGEDTVTFNASSFPVREGDAVDELLRKLPGVKVDADGNVTNQGQTITKIRVNGKDFFGGDVATAIKNLPADVIKNLQFIDDYGDQANLTGIKTGEPEKILNVTIAEDKNKGYFVRAGVGLGNEDRYNTGIRGNLFKGEERFSFDGTITNANRGGGGGNGITSTNAAGLSYQNQWNKKLSADAGYSFNNRKNITIGKAFTQNFLETFTRLEDEATNNDSDNYSHSLSGNLEYRRDSLNFLRVSPRISYNTAESDNLGFYTITQENLLTKRDNQTSNDNSSANISTNVFYNRKFRKKGRNISLRGNVNFSNGDSFRDVLNNYVITQNGLDSLRLQNQLIDNTNRNFSTSANFSYMEPLGKRNYMEFSYNWNRSVSSTNRNTNDILSGVQVFNPNLSNQYEYQFVTNRFGLNYRFIEKKYNYTLGLNAQPALLTGQNLSKNINTRNSTFNFIPSARFVYNFTKQQSLQVNYWGRNNQPGFLQLQPISDNSNLQNVVTGNPNLNPEFIHAVNARYNQTDWNMGHFLTANLSYNQTQDKIVTTKVLVPGTINQVTSYTNTDGFYTLSGDYSYGKPFADRKFTITYSGNASLNNNVAFIDASKNIAKNFNIRQELEFELDIKDIVDVEFETSYGINTTKYSQENFDDRRTNSMRYSLRGRNFFFKDLTLGYNLSKTVNSGFDNSIVKNPTILGAHLEYQFLKGNAARIRFEAFDLLDQNTGISRDVFDNIIIDRQTNRLGQYFMLSLNMTLRKFGGNGPAPRTNNQYGPGNNNNRPGGGNNNGGGYRGNN
ncbi:outer membrane beta-barrel protein [Daejeonella lutea]|uniref:Carboxypeptidase regulatory-like domain-containing protein n=1 Tax=Daejeonella lutea TaxID=572036 RepID=A0A1T5AA78_9SPHI|nr:outer membrane beta-barrel protein [Daejeonella lutea]SKB31816.1 Carboxypeptidase regulatory-like domain-containing protein [Daejeonella lutea]